MDATSLLEPSSRDRDSRRYATLRLVLLIGDTLQLDPLQRAMFQSAGLRCIGLPSLREAVTASRAAHMDAFVVDAAQLRPDSEPHLEQLRMVSHRCPMIVIGGPNSEIDDLTALSYGASAYLAGPVPPERLLAHLQVLMRLSARPAAPASAGQPSPALGEWQVDVVRSCLHSPGRVVILTDVQLSLLQCLFDAGHHIVSRGRLHDALATKRQLNGRTVDVYIHRLRRHLAKEGVKDFDIRAVRSRGYRLVATDMEGLSPSIAAQREPLLRVSHQDDVV